MRNEIVERACSYINDPTVAQDTADIIGGLLLIIAQEEGIYDQPRCWQCGNYRHQCICDTL